jgi:hypothetical protein
MPTPSTRTPVRIARGSYSNLNSSISDLQDGEISYAEDQNKLYVKEGSSLVALTFSPASPAFTGTITGVNLTLSGDLTVNGTTTTINTQTLDVEDKNIVIGKVASPSDTTADGGGITLKGSSDHTFNWVNATDAWTSSEHLVLAAGKRLLIGTTTEGHADADNFTVSGSGNTGITIRSTDSGESNLFFSDGTSGADEYRGIIRYEHNNNALVFKTNTATALTLDISQNATFAGTIANTGSITSNGGTNNQILLNSSDGCIEISRNAGGAFIDFKNSTGEDYDVRLQESSGGLVCTGTVSDSKGDLRKIIKNTKASAYVAVASDAGKCIFISSGGVTINNNVFSDGEAVTIVNNSTSDQTITQGSGLTMHNAADASSGNRVLAGRGMATIWFHIAAECYISGSGLS